MSVECLCCVEGGEAEAEGEGEEGAGSGEEEECHGIDVVYIGEGWRGGGDGASGRVAGEKQKGSQVNWGRCLGYAGKELIWARRRDH